jgi:uncharacterized Zn-finger protein
MKKPRTNALDLPLLSEERIPKEQATGLKVLIPQKCPGPITKFPQLAAMQEIATKTAVKSTLTQAQKSPRPEHLQLVKNLESPKKKQKKQAEFAPLVVAAQQMTKKQITMEPEDFEIEKKYICNLCGNSFEKKNGLTQHENTVHLNERPYSCNQCDVSFKTKGHLKQHVDFVHSEIRLYACSKCDKAYKIKSQLETHLASKHSHIKAHVCEICDKSFSLHSSLHYHLQTHSTKKKYVCTICLSRFKIKHNLTDHMKCHSNKKPYMCECGHSFKRKNNLDAHKITHSNERSYICICNKTFKFQSGLTRHQKKSCPGKPELS